MSLDVALERLREDVRYALRGMSRNLRVTCFAILSLAFGVGAASTLFSAINALDFRPLPFRDAARLVWLAEVSPANATWCSRCSLPTSAPTATDWFTLVPSVEAGAAISQTEFPWSHGDVVESPQALKVTPGILRLLGVSPVLGREFLPEDTLGQADGVALVSFDFWQQHFNGTPNILGTRLASYDEASPGLVGRSYVVVGVLPKSFRYFGNPAVWLPLRLGGAGSRANRAVVAIARLRADRDFASASTELKAITTRLAAEFPAEYKDWGVRIEPLRAYVEQNTGRGRFLVFAITGLVLLIAVLNVSGLLLSRAIARHSEFALRSALGATRARIARHVLIEGALIAVIGSTCGALLSFAGTGFVSRWFSIDQTGLPVTADRRLFAFMVGVAVLIAMVIAIVPAVRASREDCAEILRGSTVGSNSGQKSKTNVLLLLQISIGLAVLTTATVLSSDYLNIRYLELGYDPSGLFTTSIVKSHSGIADLESWRTVASSIRTRVAQIPGVAGTSIEHLSATHPTIIRPVDQPSFEARLRPYLRAVDSDYFRTWRTTLVDGRGFRTSDGVGDAPVAIVNQTLANTFWPGRNAVGQRIIIGDSNQPSEIVTVVGVVTDVERGQLLQRHWPIVYRPFAQARIYGPALSLAVRIDDNAPQAISAAEAVIHRETGQPANPFRSEQEALGTRVTGEQFNAIALDVFAAFGILLTAMGIYASVAYGVAQRTREIGIRVALGAQRPAILGSLVDASARVAAEGVFLGAIAGFEISRAMTPVRQHTTSLNPWLSVCAIGVMSLVALSAMLIPAYRATLVDPVRILHGE